MRGTPGSSELDDAASGTVATRGAAPDVDTEAVVELEHALTRRILVATAIAIPTFVVIWIALVGIAVEVSGTGFEAPVGMAVGIGVLSGVFWGAWAGFATFAPMFDEADHDHERAVE